MEISGKDLIVMTPVGSFERVPVRGRNCQVGEEILYSPRVLSGRRPAFAVLAAFAAAVVLCMALVTGLTALFSDKTVVAYISIDINPSVELGIDKSKRVRQMEGLNDKGLALIRNLTYSGRSLDDVTDKLLQKAEEMKLFEGDSGNVVIASAAVRDDVELDDALVTEQMKQQVLAYVYLKHPQTVDKVEVTAFTAPPEIIENARQNGLSVGKYSVYLNAKSAGADIKVEDLKQESVHNIAAAEGGLSKLVDPKKLEKASIKELIQEEKDGTLDKKVQDKKKATSTPTAPGRKATPTPSTKPGANSGKAPAVTPTPKSSPKAPTASTPVKAGSPAAPGKNDDRNGTGKNDDKAPAAPGGKNNGSNGKDNRNEGSPSSSRSPEGQKDDRNENKNNGNHDNKSNDNKSSDKNSDNKKNDNKDNGKNTGGQNGGPKAGGTDGERGPGDGPDGPGGQRPGP